MTMANHVVTQIIPGGASAWSYFFVCLVMVAALWGVAGLSVLKLGASMKPRITLGTVVGGGGISLGVLVVVAGLSLPLTNWLNGFPVTHHVGPFFNWVLGLSPAPEQYSDAAENAFWMWAIAYPATVVIYFYTLPFLVFQAIRCWYLSLPGFALLVMLIAKA